MIHPDYNENLNYPDLAVLEINMNHPMASSPRLRSMLLINEYDANFAFG